MRILHVVSLITPDGAYGGPIRVAVGHVKSLIVMGHDVTLIGGSSGYGEVLPESYDGVPVKLFSTINLLPNAGFAGLTSPKLLFWIAKNAKHYDVIHIHMARDLLTLAAATIVKYLKIPYVLQTHGMIDPSSKLLSIPLDKFFTVPALQAADKIFYLNARERDFITDVVGRPLEFIELRNGVETDLSDGFDRSLNSAAEILFLSRLDPQKRALAFVDMAIELITKFPDLKFVLVGPDGGDASKVKSKIIEDKADSYISWEGPLPPSETQSRMRKADIFILPSYRDAFPMSVLEAMSEGIPVIVTKSCGLASEIELSGSGIVVDDNSVPALCFAVTSLMNSASMYQSMSRNARKLIQDKFGLEAIAIDLECTYKSVVAEGVDQ